MKKTDTWKDVYSCLFLLIYLVVSSEAIQENCIHTNKHEKLQNIILFLLSSFMIIPSQSESTVSLPTAKGLLQIQIWLHIFFARFLGLWLKTGDVPIRESGECEA